MLIDEVVQLLRGIHESAPQQTLPLESLRG